MASEAALQNFPTMSSLRRSVQKGSTRYIRKPTAGLPEFDMFPPLGKTNGFVIQITEAPPPPGPPAVISEAQVTAERTPRQKPQPPPLTIPPKAYISDDQRPAEPLSPPASLPTRSRAASPTEVPLPQSNVDTPTLVRSNSGATPVMRSIFPRYDPNKPFNQQQYRPDIDKVSELASAMAVAAISSRAPPSHSQQANSRPSSAYLPLEREKQKAAESKESPFRPAENAEHEVGFSSPKQLLDLWDIANGQTASKEVGDTYILELSCEDLTLGREVITFNASTSDPIYTLEASRSNNITISRTHPGNRNPTIQITTSTLEKPTSAEPLVSCTFPKLAGLMAVDHSSTISVARKLDRKASGNLQTEAVTRAQEQETSMLLWDSDSNRYCLMHPTLLDSAPTTIPVEIIPDPSNPTQITFHAPETHSPLLTLSLRALALTVHASAIKALPSLYILDTLMSSLLALLLHLHRSCATNTTPSSSSSVSPPNYNLKQPPLFPPPPVHPSPRPSSSSSSFFCNNSKRKSPSRFSVFRPNKPTRSTRSLHSAYNGPDDRDTDIELQHLPLPQQQQQHQPPKQIFSANDEALPKTTRAALKLLYWAFEVLFWFLGVVVQVLAAGVVGAGKLVAKL